MKYLFTLSLTFFSLCLFAQDSKTTLMRIVLADSVISKYMADIGKEDNNEYKLFHGSGYYIFNDGNVEFQGLNGNNSGAKKKGIIKKIKINKNKAIVKFYTASCNNTRVSLKKESKNWEIKSRLIYRSWKHPKKQPKLVYYSLN
ncbi:hypothetical protein [Cyclobacterium amurskyense]|uniref:Uncharacterized protein n=1 Tax=Cyclobacterium amurskyense TaxID=320787 RepID=A0A0H4PK77_9BACT|nr:hypothetical protein [Cyclobacterium amurskyense]AKP53393.1 hypothetical protein CA2015_4033 [Cyclobacterium amurskyense]